MSIHFSQPLQVSLLSVFGLVLLVQPALAGNSKRLDLKRNLKKCAIIKGDVSRLSCFDGLTKTLGLAPTTKRKKIRGAGLWKTNVETNPIDDSKTVILSLEAKGKSTSYKLVPTMIVRCRSKKVEIYIAWGDYLGSEAKVTSRIGSAKATTAAWSVSTDSKATFLPSDPVEFLGSLLEVDKYVAQVTPYGESPVTAIFDTQGLNAAIKPLAEVCMLKFGAQPDLK